MKIIKMLFCALILIFSLSCSKSQEKKNVIFILIDTLRADHTSYFGYERNTTPNLDKFAKESLAFMNTFSPAPWTPAAMASIFTGLYPSVHGMIPPNSREDALKASAKLTDKVYTLAELFKDNGYETFAVQTNPWLTPEFGYSQGFEKYVYKHRRKANIVNEEGYKLINNYLNGKKDKPFFLYLHYLDPHNPYQAPKEYDSLYNDKISGNYKDNAQELIRKYDREVKYTDDRMGELFKFLKEKDLYDDSIIVILADHGEQFFERGHHGHGFYLFNEETHVPFYLRAKSHKGEVTQAVSSLDLFETLVDLNKLENKKSTTQGFSLVSEESLEKRKRSDILSEIKRKFQQKSIVTTNLNKLIIDYDLNIKDEDILKSGKLSEKLFNLENDPKEQKQVEDQKLLEKMQKRFDKVYLKMIKNKIKLDEDDTVKMDSKTAKELKSLGYL